MSDRGDYRSFYAAIVDDPDFQALDPLAFKTLFALKMTLGAAGIGIARTLVLCEQIGCTREQLEHCLQLLEAPKSDDARGWIVRERNIVWIVNGLKFEPTLSADNAKKHRPYVRRLLAPLGDRPIVREFIAYYAQWFDSCPVPSDTDRVSEGKGYPDDRVSVGNRNTATKASASHSDVSQATATKPATATPTSEDGGTAAARSREIAQAFFAEFYHDAPDRLKRQVHREMAEVLAEGTMLRGQRIRAFSPKHLDDMLLETLREGGRIEKPHSAWSYTLKKLADTSRTTPGRVTGEQLADEAKRSEQESEAYDRARREAAIAWQKANPEEAATIRERVNTEFPVTRGEVGDLVRERAVITTVAEWTQFPDFDTWLEQRRAS